MCAVIRATIHHTLSNVISLSPAWSIPSTQYTSFTGKKKEHFFMHFKYFLLAVSEQKSQKVWFGSCNTAATQRVSAQWKAVCGSLFQAFHTTYFPGLSPPQRTQHTSLPWPVYYLRECDLAWSIDPYLVSFKFPEGPLNHASHFNISALLRF